MSDLPPLELQCFGVPSARLNGSPAPAELLRRKHLALLVYLALSPNRQRTRSHLVGLLWPETGEAQARHSLNEAIRRLRAHAGDARLALALQPYAEPAAQLLMRARALAGDTTGALAAFHEFVARLAEIGEQPGREVAALAERIRGQSWRRSTRLQPEDEPALVGQQRAHGEAFTLVTDALQRGPRTLLITGDPGVGKTRLVTDCRERFGLAGP